LVPNAIRDARMRWHPVAPEQGLNMPTGIEQSRAPNGIDTTPTSEDLSLCPRGNSTSPSNC